MHGKDETPVGKGCALWLMPEEPIFGLLTGRIAALSREFSTPPFDPHITLLAGIELPEEESLARCSSLATRLKPLRVEIGEMEHAGEYFRCVFASVVPTESILHARLLSKETFDVRDRTAFAPHLSLLYGSLPVEKRKEIAAGHSFLSGKTFDVRRFAIYRVSGAPSKWELLKEFNFGQLPHPKTSS